MSSPPYLGVTGVLDGLAGPREVRRGLAEGQPRSFGTGGHPRSADGSAGTVQRHRGGTVPGQVGRHDGGAARGQVARIPACTPSSVSVARAAGSMPQTSPSTSGSSSPPATAAACTSARQAGVSRCTRLTSRSRTADGTIPGGSTASWSSKLPGEERVAAGAPVDLAGPAVRRSGSEGIRDQVVQVLWTQPR